jgi:hypothetical protein
LRSNEAFGVRMARNMSSVDASCRGVLAVAFVVFGVASHGIEIVSFGAVLLGIVLMATALTRECPFYRAFHLHTHRPSAAPDSRRA